MTSDEPELNDEPEDDVRATPPLDRGVWCVRSAGSTVYWVDLDRGRLLRVPGDGSSTGPYDGVWVPLVSVERLAIGERPRYLTDPDGGVHDYRWWLQRRVVSIKEVDPQDAPADGSAPRLDGLEA